MVKVKICGVRTEEAAQACAQAGADMVGFNFHMGSRRLVTPARAKALVPLVRPAQPVGVFVDAEPAQVIDVAGNLAMGWVQLHGWESPDVCAEIKAAGLRVIKALRVGKESMVDYRPYEAVVDLLLFDAQTPGGGEPFDWTMIEGLQPQAPFYVAGGLTPQNVVRAVQELRPFGVDTASGVEENGVQSPQRIAAFIAAARGAGAVNPEAEPTLVQQKAVTLEPSMAVNSIPIPAPGGFDEEDEVETQVFEAIDLRGEK